MNEIVQAPFLIQTKANFSSDFKKVESPPSGRTKKKISALYLRRFPIFSCLPKTNLPSHTTRSHTTPSHNNRTCFPLFDGHSKSSHTTHRRSPRNREREEAKREVILHSNQEEAKSRKRRGNQVYLHLYCHFLGEDFRSSQISHEDCLLKP